MSWIEEKAQAALARVNEARDRQVYPYFREFETGGLHTTIAGKPVVNFSSNDYLGLTSDPEVRSAAKAAIDRYGTGLGSSRVQATTDAHVALEQRLAAWYGFESCLVFTTGYQAMVGTIMALADKDTTLILDSYSHACILDGAFLAAGTPANQPELRFFNHNSARSLARCLRTRERKNALVLIEGIYSLDGDEAELIELLDICEEAGAVVICDDAHGTGTLGHGGRGILEKYGVAERVPVVISTFSKTFGGIGGILLGSEQVVDHIKHAARSFLFSASLPSPMIAAASTILDRLEAEGPALVSALKERADYMRKGLLDAGFDLGKSNTHIMPIMVRDERKTLFLHVALMEHGILMVPITYPGVKQGEERLRLNVTLAHSYEDMDRAIALLTQYGRSFKLVA